MGLCQCKLNSNSTHGQDKDQTKAHAHAHTQTQTQDQAQTSALEIASFDVEEFSLKGKEMYGKVVYIYDGDTIYVVINLDSKMVKFNCRLNGIDSPEIRPKKSHTKRDQEIKMAILSRNYLIEKLTGIKPHDDITKKEIKDLCAKSTKLVWIKFMDFDKYGRVLVEIYTSDPSKQIPTENPIKSVNYDMIEQNYAIAYDGGTKSEFFST